MLKIGKEEKECSGCRICEMVCALQNFGECNPKKSFIKIKSNFPASEGYKIVMRGCKLCGECLKRCPKGAIFIKEGVPVAKAVAAGVSSKTSLPGYAGKILWVDLSNKAIWTTILTPEFAKEWIGGRGFAAKILFDQEAGVDPLGPKNRVVIASGPLSGAFAPANSKVTFASKSPLTGGYGDSNMGGHLAAEMKYAGYDAIVIFGKSETPVYLFINGDKVEIRDAKKYWGQGSMTAEKMLKDDLGGDFQIAVIGPAGENLVRFACISHDFGRQAGRTGIGTVLGSKKLKAIAVCGDKPVPVADVALMTQKTKELLDYCQKQPALKTWQKYGTPSVTAWANEIGALPCKNFQDEHVEDVSGLKDEVMREKIVVHDKACMLCPMACGKYSHSKKEGKYNVFVEGPEYETIALCGANCGFTNIEDVAYLNYLCDQVGVDTISAGGVIAFTIECFEKGFISRRETGGRELKWGDIETFEYLLGEMTFMTGLLGPTLARGVKVASSLIPGTEKFAIHVKGLEWSGYGSRDAPAMMLSYLTCDDGGHHNRSWAITRDIDMGRDVINGKAEVVIHLQHARPMFDMLGACRLLWVELGLGLESYPEMLKTITGSDCTLEELLKISERVWNLTRLFWTREAEGFGRAYDQPPARFLEERVKSGPTKGKKFSKRNLRKLLKDYYQLRGWDKNGLPAKKKLKELNLT